MMSARQVFQHAFAHAELTRPPDDYPYHLRHAHEVQLEMQRRALPMDGQSLMTLLNCYGLEDEVGLFIYKNHPQLTAKIIPALAAGLGPANTWLKHGDEFRKNRVINLAQSALDGLKEPNTESDVKKDFDTLVALYFSQGRSLDAAVAKARADIDDNTELTNADRTKESNPQRRRH